MNDFKRNIFMKSATSIVEVIVEDVVIDDGICQGVYSFKVITDSEVTINFSSIFASIASYVPVAGLMLPSGYQGIDSNITVSTSVDKGYMFGIFSQIFPGGGAPSFISQVSVEIFKTSTSELLYQNNFTRNHTDAIC